MPEDCRPRRVEPYQRRDNQHERRARDQDDRCADKVEEPAGRGLEPARLARRPFQGVLRRRDRRDAPFRQAPARHWKQALRLIVRNQSLAR